ncbi:MAG: glycosyltransferase [Flavobacteriaceae bacterium]|nr:glycosyltransferase [Flavobacteriaceae bacterium]
MKPYISIVMATFNGEEYIGEAIESVLSQTYKNFEIIIIDDGSTDETSKIINSFKDDRIKYVKKEHNSGIADSLNIGISLAKGEYIARMDDDDVCMPNRFELQVNVLNKNKNIIVCGTNVYSKNKLKIRKTPEFHKDILQQMVFVNPMVHPSVMIRKNILIENKYDADMVPSEDYDLWSRLIFLGDFYNIQEPLLYYRDHGNSQTTKRRKEQLFKNVAIFEFILKKLGFTDEIVKAESLFNFASHNYSIPGKKIKELINWFDKLKQANTKLTSNKKFNEIADNNLNNYLVSYFINQKTSKKIIPFLYLKFKQKLLIANYYISKNGK